MPFDDHKVSYFNYFLELSAGCNSTLLLFLFLPRALLIAESTGQINAPLKLLFSTIGINIVCIIGQHVRKTLTDQLCFPSYVHLLCSKRTKRRLPEGAVLDRSATKGNLRKEGNDCPRLKASVNDHRNSDFFYFLFKVKLQF